MKIVCFGDSLTFGFGVYPSKCWVSLLRQCLKCDVLNKGTNGDTTSGMLSRSYMDIIESKPTPTHAIIMGGTNDLLQGYSLNNIISNIEELILESEKNNIEPIIAVQIPVEETMAKIYWYDGIDYNSVNKNLEIYKNWVIEYSANNSIKHINFYSRFIEELQKKEKSELYIDGIHPTALGHKIMASCAVKLIDDDYHPGNN